MLSLTSGGIKQCCKIDSHTSGDTKQHCKMLSLTSGGIKQCCKTHSYVSGGSKQYYILLSHASGTISIIKFYFLTI